ncbi:MAG: hypothetical protein EOP88_16085 [Verrucomicrobiaceae bacterium]|nr:MAG: hypothetical protein EOP88_16085 [Verrucomicrobiaceae bacterium]
MMRFWQAAVVICSTMTLLGAQEEAKPFPWVAIKVEKSGFTAGLGMLDSEREEYATTLSTLAGNRVASAKASPASLTEARKMISLALQLSPRNKRTIVVNFQLAKGVLPDPVESNYSAQVFARLILTRGQLLTKQGGVENLKLARYFTQLAAEMDPKNEDAVYASEVQRLDQGAPDWAALTDVAGKKE